MSNLQIAAEQALKSLGDAITAWTEEMMFRSCVSAADAWIESADTLRAALAQPEQERDPVAWNGWIVREVLFDEGEPLGHRERKPLTDEKILEAWKPFEGNPFTTKYEFARAIERAHGIEGEK